MNDGVRVLQPSAQALAKKSRESLRLEVIGLTVVWLVMSLCAGCGGTPPASTATAGVTVKAWTGDTISLPLHGSMVHPRPLAHALVRPWIPLRSVADEGSLIEKGSPVAELDGDLVTRWANNDRLQLAEQLAQNYRDT